LPRPVVIDHCRTERHQVRARLAALTRVREPGDPEIEHERRRLAAVKAKGLLLSAMDELKAATNPVAPDMDLPLQFCQTAADEIARRLDAAAG
jgi:hypothetical protein